MRKKFYRTVAIGLATVLTLSSVFGVGFIKEAKAAENYIQVTDIPDEELYARILQAGDINGDGILTKEEIEGITTLDLGWNYEYEYLSIKDFTGLSKLVNLNTLYIDNMYFAETENVNLDEILTQMLDEIQGMELLNLRIYFAEFDETDFRMLENLPIEYLDIKINGNGSFLCPEDIDGKKLYEKISSINIYTDESFSMNNFSKMINLQNITVNGSYVSNNKITDISAVKTMNNLLSISMYGYFEEFDIGDLENISSVSLNNYNNIKTKINLSELPNTTWLTLYNFEILDSIQNINENITGINMYNCKLTEADLEPDFSKYNKLYNLSVENCGIKSVSGLDKIPALWYVNFSNNKLTEVPDFISNKDMLTVKETDIDGNEYIINYNGVSYIDLSYNNIKDISSIAENKVLQEKLCDLYISNNEIETLPDMSVLSCLRILNLSNNKLSDLKSVGLDKLDFDYYGLNLSGNNLTLDALKEGVSQKLWADPQWRADATSINIDGVNVYTIFDNELLSERYEEYVDLSEESDTIYLNFYVCCEKISISSEILEQLTENKEVHVIFTYYDKAEEKQKGTVELDCSKLTEDVKSAGLEIDLYALLNLQKADERVQNAIGCNSVYTSFTYDPSLEKDYLYIYLCNQYYYYNVYTYTAGAATMVARKAYNGYFEGKDTDKTYYYVPTVLDLNRNVTDNEGEYSDPQEGIADNGFEVFEKAVADASEGDTITIPVTNIYIQADTWNQIINKKLTVTFFVIDECNDVTKVITLDYTKMNKVSQMNYLYLDVDYYINTSIIDSETEAVPVEITAFLNLNAYDNDDTYNSQQTIKELEDFSLDAKLYVGDKIKNGAIYIRGNYYTILNKDMYKQSIFCEFGEEYTVKSGMIDVSLSAGKSLYMYEKQYAKEILNAIENPEEAPIPDYSNTQENSIGDLLASYDNGSISNINLKGALKGYTVTVSFDYLDSPYSYVDGDFPLFSLQERKLLADGGTNSQNKYLLAHIDTKGNICIESNNSSNNIIGYNFTKNGNYTVKILFYNKDEATHAVVYMNNELIEDKILLNDETGEPVLLGINDYNTFYNADYPIEYYNYYTSPYCEFRNACTKVFAGDYTSMITAGFVPTDLVWYDPPVIETVEAIKGNLVVWDFYTGKTGAVPLKTGDDITFTFKNTSYGTSVCENFVMAITGATGYAYENFMQEVLVIRADKYGWGGGMSDFVAPDVTGANILVFTGDILDEEAFESEMQKGAECIINLKREGNKLIYNAQIGSYKFALEAMSGIELPETLYVFFTGENVSLTDFDTVYNIDTEEQETTKEPQTTKEPETTDAPVSITTEKGVKSPPLTVDASEIVPVEDVVKQAIELMQTSAKKTIEVITNKAPTLTSDVLKAAEENGKNITIGVTDDNNRLQYSWTFSNKTLKDTDIDIDLTITFDSNKKEEIETLTGRTDSLYMRFSYHGKLPGPTTIKTYVGDKYANGEKVYLYYFDEEQQKILMIGNKSLEVKAGYVEYTITHCSTYFLVAEHLEGVELDSASLADASINVADLTDEQADAVLKELSVKTGDESTNMTAFIVALLALGAVVAMGFSRKKEEEQHS